MQRFIVLALLLVTVRINLEPVYDENRTINEALNKPLMVKIVGPLEILPLAK